MTQNRSQGPYDQLPPQPSKYVKLDFANLQENSGKITNLEICKIDFVKFQNLECFQKLNKSNKFRD